MFLCENRTQAMVPACEKDRCAHYSSRSVVTHVYNPRRECSDAEQYKGAGFGPPLNIKEVFIGEPSISQL